MRPLTAIFVLVVSAIAARAADGPGPDALPPGAADGWVRLFDGGDFSGLVIDGDAKLEDGALVIGGAKPARLSVKRDLGDEFEVRLIYRTEPTGGLQVRAEWSGLGSHSSIGTTAPEPPAMQGAPPEWRELRCAAHKGAPHRPYEIRLANWRDGKETVGQGMSAGSDDGGPELWFEVPAGTKLLLRGAAAHPDPSAGSVWRSPWAFGGVLLAVLVVLAATVLLVVRRLGRWATVPAAPSPELDLPAEE